jgi:hypothetical protein
MDRHCKRVRYALLFCLILAMPALAQNTSITGTVTDPNGLPYAGGTVMPQLVLVGGASPTVNGFFYIPPTSPSGLNSAGVFSVTLPANASISPAGSQWKFTVCSGAGSIQPAGGKGSVCFNVTVTISGTSQDLSTTLQAAAPALAFAGGGTSFTPFTPVAHNFLTGVSALGVFSGAQPACGDLSNAAASCATDATNASNIGTGTLPAARLPNPTASTLGGVESFAPVSHNFLTGISTGGAPSAAQPSSTDLSDAATLLTLTGAQTATNKRVTPRAVSVATATSITPNSDTSDEVTQVNTQTAGTLTINAPTGTPTDGQKLILRITSTNAQTYSFNAAYSFSTTTPAPTGISATKTDYIGCIWNANASVWNVVAVDQGH